jgi:hypothetical protein
MSAWTKVFTRAWFGILALISAVWIPASLFNWVSGRAGPETLWWTLHPVGMALFGWGLVRFGRWLGRNEEIALREWLRDTLSGVVLPPP